MAKKKSSTHKNVDHHEKNIKALTALFILLLAFGVFFLFYVYQENILESSSSQIFMVLTAACFSLLAALLFLVNKPHKN
ncbi:MAG: hypothetical protein A2171_01775 [Candidatus Levybacteria bacterium RBG_13_35_9]|nr:MAG: hypothetical protein A2171_01775 [Candidatus Levybacteria bacterium RBG_13_35_9]